MRVVVAAALAWLGRADSFDGVRRVLQNAVASQVFPGCVAVVGTKEGGVLFAEPFGKLTYPPIDPPASPGVDPDVTMTTRYDMASISKIIATTSAVAQFYQRGELGLFDRVSDPRLLGSAYANNGKDNITIVELLTHSAGYPPDPDPGYWEVEFGCPATKQTPPPLTLSCTDMVFASLLNQTLASPPNQVFVYSDLSMITLHFVVGSLAESLGYVTQADLLPECQALLPSMGQGLRKTCFYEAYVRVHVFEALELTSTTFRPPASLAAQIAPTWNDTDYRMEVVQGVVSDENSYANGGICGHAGVFSAGADVATFLQLYLHAPAAGATFLNATTVAKFTTPYNLTQSSRALGWDTNEPNNAYNPCGELSPLTYNHLGYTGTTICVDPINNLFTVLLDNRVYPDKTGRALEIQTVRQAFNTAALVAVAAVREAR